MAAKKIHSIVPTVLVSAVTSLLFFALFTYLYFYTPVLTRYLPTSTAPLKLSSQESQFAQYETLVNEFLAYIQKGEIEAAYKGTSPIFQKLSTLDSFRKLTDQMKTDGFIQPAPCVLTEYSEPFTGTITGIPDSQQIVQTKCEFTEKAEIKGFSVEFIEDAGTPKISFINVYKTPVVHKKSVN